MRVYTLAAALGLVLSVVVVPTPSSAFRVCILSSQDFTSCDNTTDPFTKWTGYDIDYFRWVAKELKWVEGYDEDSGNAPPESRLWSFSCIQNPDWNGMMRELANDSLYSQCAAAVGEISITSKRLNMGVQFSDRTRRAGVGTLVSNQASTKFSAWGFFGPFNWTLWVAFVLTLCVMPGIFWFVETVSANGYVELSRNTLPELREAGYITALTPFNVHTFPATHVASQTIVVSLCVLSLILTTNYIANLMASLTLVTVTPQFTNVTQLQGYTVAASPIYAESLSRLYGINNVESIPWVGSSTFLQVSELIRDQQLTAAMYDAVGTSSLLKLTNPGCALTLMTELILPVDFGFAFHHLFPIDLLDSFNQQMKAADEMSLPNTLENRYIVFADRCTLEARSASAGIASITFAQLRGLWIIVGSVMAFVALWSVWTIFQHVGQHMDDLHLQEPKSLTAQTTPSGRLRTILSLEPQPSTALSSVRSVSMLRHKVRITRKAFARVFIRAGNKPQLADSRQNSVTEDKRGAGAFADGMHVLYARSPSICSSDTKRRAMGRSPSFSSLKGYESSDTGAGDRGGDWGRLPRPGAIQLSDQDQKQRYERQRSGGLVSRGSAALASNSYPAPVSVDSAVPSSRQAAQQQQQQQQRGSGNGDQPGNASPAGMAASRSPFSSKGPASETGVSVGGSDLEEGLLDGSVSGDGEQYPDGRPPESK